jgi:hypothetical protein
MILMTLQSDSHPNTPQNAFPKLYIRFREAKRSTTLVLGSLAEIVLGCPEEAVPRKVEKIEPNLWEITGDPKGLENLLHVLVHRTWDESHYLEHRNHPALQKKIGHWGRKFDQVAGRVLDRVENMYISS